jgi:hypothetical protein
LLIADCCVQAAGIANSTGLGPDDIMRMALFPELIKMSCSMFGAWGPATASTNSKLVQLRALVRCVYVYLCFVSARVCSCV